MNPRAILGAVARRWYVALVTLAVFGALALVGYRDSPPSYTTSTVLVVLPSRELLQFRSETGAFESGFGNPFGISANATLAALLADDINTGGVLIPSGLTATGIEAVVDPQTPRAYFTVQATARTREDALMTLQAIVDQSPSLLADLQTGAGSPSDQTYTSYASRSPVEPALTFPARLRTSVGAALAGAAVATLLCVFLDALVLRRQSRKSRVEDVATERVGDPETPSPNPQGGTTASQGPTAPTDRH